MKVNWRKFRSMIFTFWISILVILLFVCDLGLVTYPSHWYILVSESFMASLIGKTFAYRSLITCTFMGIGIFLFALGILTKYSVFFFICSFIFQLSSVISCLTVGYLMPPSKYDELYNTAITNFASLDIESFQNKSQCQGVKITGCTASCCDKKISLALQSVLKPDVRWLFIFPNVWLGIISVLFPSLVLFWHCINRSYI